MNGYITKVNLACGKDNLASPLYQYDYGQVLQLLGVDLPEAYEVHFSNSPRGEAKTAIGNEDGVIIPDEYLLTGAPVYAWLYLHTGESDGETEYRITIPVIARAKPTDAEPTPVQQGAITQAIAALNTAVTESAQSAEAAAGSAELAEESAELAERYAESAQTAAGNADTSAQNAAQSASEAATSAAEAEAARDTITGMSVTAQTLPAGSDATASWADGTLALGIPRGGKGDTGNGIASAVLNSDYTLTLTFTDGTSYTTPSIRGVIGETGNGIASAVLNADYTLTLTFTDGTSYTTPSLRGANGVGVPTGGTAGQVMTKASDTDFDAEWADLPQTVEIDPTLTVSGEAADAKAAGDVIRAMCPVATVGPSAIVSVNDAVPLIAEGLVAQIEPVQDLHGYDNPWPAGGGVNKLDIATVSITKPAWYTGNWLGITKNDNAGITQERGYTNGGAGGFTVALKPGETYTISWTYNKSINDYCKIFVTSYNGTERTVILDNVTVTSSTTRFSVSFTLPSDSVEVAIRPTVNGTTQSGQTYDFDYIQIESGSTATAWTPYSNICPISGWTGCEVKHSGADVSDPTIIPVTFPASAGTVYGGYVDLVSGKLVVDRVMPSLTGASLYRDNGTFKIWLVKGLPSSVNINGGRAICNITKLFGNVSSTALETRIQFPSGTQSNMFASIPADFNIEDVQACYELATPITYDIDPVTLTLLSGANNVWVDTGDTTLTYRQDGQGAVQDVQVNGVSVLNEGVANVPVAGANELGVVAKGGGNLGIAYNQNSQPYLTGAQSNEIKSGSHVYKPIVPYRQHEAAFYGLAKAAGDTTQSASSNAVGTYTENAKSKISEMLNAPITVSGTTPTITALSGIQYVCGEVATLDITLPESGIVDVVFQSGSTPTVLTITPPTGMTVEWANDFDSTALEADTMYELNIKMVGTKCLGVAGAWS